MNKIYLFILGEEGNYPTRSMCRWAKVSTSGYYAWRKRPASPTSRRRRTLQTLIRSIFDDSDQTYGYRRVHATLIRSGYQVDDETVRLMMAELGLLPCQRRRWRPVTTKPGEGATDLPDLVQRDFTAQQPGRKLVGDITYIPTWEGFVYLATVLDCCTKKAVGFAMAGHMRADLVVDALKMAALRVDIIPGKTIFHSDRGGQYLSDAYAKAARNLGVKRSVGRTGVCYDNAWAESFNGTLKVERVNRTSYPTRQAAIDDVTRYIEGRYNSRRLHSGLGYRTPNEAEAEFKAKKNAA